METLADGSVTLSMDVPVNYEIISWIMGFGSAAEVIQPPALRDRILSEHEKAAMQYESWPKKTDF